MKNHLLFLLTLLMLLGITGGCGIFMGEAEEAIEEIEEQAEDVIEEIEDEEIDDSELDIDEEELHTFANIAEFGKMFKEIELTVIESALDEEEGDNVFSYIFLGEDTVDGVETQHVKMIAPDAPEETIEVWITEDQEVIKAVVDGEEEEYPEMYGMMLIYFDLIAWDLDLDWINWEITNQSSGTKDLGAGSFPTITYEVIPPGEETVLTYEVGKIAGHNMLISMEVIDAEGAKGGIQVTKLIPR